MDSAPRRDTLENGHATSPAKPRHAPITAAEIRAEFVHHDGTVARVNNGSFGSCPASVQTMREQWQHLFLAQPDAFYFNLLQPGLARARASVAAAIGAEGASEVSLIDNTTTAAAIIMQHLAWSFAEGAFMRGDAVLMLHHTYSSDKQAIQAYVARAGATLVEVPLSFPVTSPAAIVAEFCAALLLAKSGGRRVRLAIIDHITSMPSVLIPINDLVAICQEEGVGKVFVDGSHAIGQVPINVRDIGADFYASNLHKWFFCPATVAFLHVRKDDPIASQLHHPVVSSEYGKGLPMESSWIGVRDYSAQLVVPDAIDFINRFEGGIKGICRRNHEKVVEMGLLLAKAWGTFLGSPPEMCASMVMVRLPGCLGIESHEDAMTVRTLLRNDFKVEVPIFVDTKRVERAHEEMARDVNGDQVIGYVRVSHQVYNVREEYEVLRDAVNKLVLDGFSCSKLKPSEKVFSQ